MLRILYTTYDARNATVTFTCAELTKQVPLTQTMNNGLMVTQTSYELTKASQQLHIEVKANVKFSVEVDNGCKDWVKYNTTKGLTTSTVVLDIAENKTYDSREGKVTIKQDGGSLSSTVTIKQSQLDGLFLTISEYTLSNEKHSLTVEVSTNIEFDVKPEADWVKYVQTKGLSTKQIVLEVAENDTYDQRETKINVKQKNGDLSGTITIKQDEKYGILVTQSEFDLTNEAQTIEVEVKYNVDFDVVIPDGCKDWIKQVSTKGLNTKNYTFSIAKNETYVNREGSITFKQKNGELSSTASINQAQLDYLTISPLKDSISYNSNVAYFSIITNVPYSVSIPSDATWLKLSNPEEGETIEGLTSYLYNVSVQENESTSQRKADLFVKSNNDALTVIYTLIQGPEPIICFADPLTKELCVNNWDLNNDGELSEKEAAKVSSIDNVFSRQGISHFDEFHLFTGLSELPSYGFQMCTNLVSISLPPNIKYIGGSAFEDCVNLTDISFSKKLETMDWGAFKGCQKLRELVFADGLKYIGNNCFSGCSNLKSIVLPSTVETIEWSSFYNCKSLKSIVLPESLLELVGNTFSGCSELESVVILSKNLVKIGDSAFSECSSLSSIVIPPNVAFIGQSCFSSCSNLIDISLPDGLLSIGSCAFMGCSQLTEIAIPKEITKIADYTFENCTHLTNISLPSNLEEIGISAFRGCTRLKRISIPDGVRNIGKYAFNECGSLVSVDLPNSINSIGEGTFWDCKDLQKINIPQELTTLEKRMFSGCVSLSEISFPESIKTIGDYAFFDCRSLTVLSIPKTITNIGYASFLYCLGLSKITLYADNPPILSGEKYDGLTFDCTNNCPIFVPLRSVESYKTAPIWIEYADRIQAIPE